MSPSESELRAALRTGEGQGVDADSVLTHARGVRHARRLKITSAVGAVVVVAGIGTGISLLAGTSSPGGSRGSANGVAASAGAPQPNSGLDTSGSRAVAACPRTPLHMLLPGGGGTSQFGAGEPLVTRPVSSLRICGYAAGSLGGAVGYGGSLTLDGSDAQQFADSLNNAATTPPHVPCPTPVQSLRELVVYPTDASGAALSPVVVNVGTCPVLATNGTAVRYAWTPPQRWAGPLNALMVPREHVTTVRPPSHPSGSPLH